uniref:uncharacterized protein n=1 Tax=Pristiophorus japonicus TaxID=55135 RepID=UPI00398E64BA
MGPAWKKTISTAQAGPTLEGEELEANPDDAEEDSDEDEPEEENIFQSNPPDQEHGVEWEGMELNKAPTVVLTLEEVPLMEVTAPSVTSGLSVGGTFHGFTPSEAAGPSGVVQQGTPRVPPSQAAGPSVGMQATPVGRRGRRARPRSPEEQDLTDVLQMMSLSAESIDLTRSLLDAISGVSNEVAGLSGEVAAMTREMGTISGTISEGIVAMREGMSEVVQTTTRTMREGMSEVVQTTTRTMREGMLQVIETLSGPMKDGMLELAAAIREHAQTPRPLTESTVTPTPIPAPASEEPKARPPNLPPDAEAPHPQEVRSTEMLKRISLVPSPETLRHRLRVGVVECPRLSAAGGLRIRGMRDGCSRSLLLLLLLLLFSN